MNIFVTGGTGFVGTPVVSELVRRGHRLLVLTRDPEKARAANSNPAVSWVQGDLTDIPAWRDTVARFRPDALVHMAWEGIPDYGVATSVKNLTGGLALYRALTDMGCTKIVTTGSQWEHGPQTGPLAEDARLEPYNAFAGAKIALLHIGSYIARERAAEFVWARLFSVYGPGQKAASLIPTVIARLKEGKQPELKTPQAQNDFIHVEDVARAVATLVEKRFGAGAHVFNVGSGSPTSIETVVSAVYTALDTPAPRPSGKPPLPAAYADIGKLRRETGWEPLVGIEAGVASVAHRVTTV